nr:50S ribosomal protein L11 methyltransferase [Aestuariivirga litoralis]
MMDKIENDFAIDALAVTINETDEAKALWETVAWFSSAEEAEDARAHFNLAGAAVAPVPDRDWVRESLAGLNPVVAGRFFLHGSHDRPSRRAGGISLEIDAGTAFGTGHHGTTWGCLEALDDILKRHRPARMLDLGTGTGVLGLAAAKALRSHVLATDIDPEAVRVAKLNAIHNGSGPWFKGLTAAGLHDAAIRKAAPYDLIFANILARPLAMLAPGIVSMLEPRGHLILSGLTVDQLRWIKAVYTARGLITRRVINSENWIALVMTKPSRQNKSRASRKAQLIGSKGLGWAEDA